MDKKTYLWIEDRENKASFLFWKTLMRELFPEVTVEAKKNSSELVKAVKSLEDVDGRYIVVHDNSFDNVQAYQEQKFLKHYVSARNNVFLLDIICFEYILLEFGQLIQWVYAPDDEFRIKRAKVIAARNKLIEVLGKGMVDYKQFREIIDYDGKLDSHNIEQLSAKLLYDLTRNTGFEVSKGKIGDCWLRSCCEWEKRQENDICGLDNDRLGLADKMKRIYIETSLRAEFAKVGLEVS